MISRRIKCLYISIILFLGAFVIWHLFFDNSIRFSKPQGFYDDEFDLKIKTRLGTEVYYTLDGSDPSRDSMKYAGPIHIYDATKNDNIHSMVEEISIYYREDLTGEDNPYKAPDYNIDKCIPLRVAVFNKRGELINETIQNYWIDLDDKEGYDDLYIVSLITDPSNLFDYEKGIYVNGKALDQFVEREGILENSTDYETNYNLSGKDSERLGYFSVYSAKREKIYESKCGIRVQGSGSRRLAQKNFGITSIEEKIQINGIGGDEGVEKIKLFAGGQDDVLKLKDWLITSIVKDSNLEISTQKMIPTALFLDGEYWGTYYIVENYDEDYVYNHFGVGKDNVIIIKDGELKEGTLEDKEEHYDNIRKYIINNHTEEDIVSIVDDYYDLESLIDYYALQIYIGNIDFYEDFNMECWKTTGSGNGKYSDGKIRWMLYDVNYVDCLIKPDNIALKRCLKEHEIFRELMKDPDFRERFKDRVIFISRELFSEENIDNYIEPWFEIMESPLKSSSMRFYGEDNSEDIYEEITEIKEFCNNREAIFLEQFEKIDEYLEN